MTTKAIIPLIAFISLGNLEAQEAAVVAEPVAEVPSGGPQGADVSALIDWLLANADALHALPFSGIIESTTGKKILPMEENDAVSKAILEALDDVMAEALKKLSLSSSPIRGLRRINEASRFFEDEMVAGLDALSDFACDIPPLADGKIQRSGYPDMRLTHLPSGRIAYIDPKLFEDKSKASSLRTFYFEPKVETNKVLADAHHLLVGIAHDGNDGKWKFTSWHAVDLSKFQVRLKAEFQASNKDLYREESIVREGGDLVKE